MRGAKIKKKIQIIDMQVSVKFDYGSLRRCRVDRVPIFQAGTLRPLLPAPPTRLTTKISRVSTGEYYNYSSLQLTLSSVPRLADQDPIPKTQRTAKR